MAVLDRVFLGLIALVLTTVAVILLLTVFGSNLLVVWLRSANLIFDGTILAAIFLLLALYLVIVIGRRKQAKFIVYPKELGAIRISVDCVEGLIVEAARQMAGLEQVKAVITDVEEPRVTIRVQVHPDYNIPELSEELQANVKSYVESTVGVVLQEIEVSVLGISKRNDPDHQLIA